MPKRNRKPDQSQSDLFQDRSRLIRLLRGLKGTGTPARKLMLWELDAFIGRYGSITLVSVRPQHVRLGFEAPPDVSVSRVEEDALTAA